MSTRPAPSVLRRLLMGLAVAAGVLGGAELLLRAVAGPPGPAVRVYGVLGEGAAYWHRDGDLLRPAWTSGDGLVRTHREIPCRVDHARVLVLGGSSVHGGDPRLPARAEFPGILGERTRTPTLNLGYPALDSHDLVAILEGFGDCSADAVVVYAGHNDLGNIYFMDRYGDLSSGVGARVQSVLERSQLYRWLGRLVRPADGRSRAADALEAAALVSPDQLERAHLDFARNMERLAWLCAQAGRPLVLVGAVSVDWPEEDQLAQTLVADEGMHAAMRRVAQGAEHVQFVDPRAGLPGDAQGLDRALFIDRVHFSRRGHRALGELLAPVVQPLVGSPAAVR